MDGLEQKYQVKFVIKYKAILQKINNLGVEYLNILPFNQIQLYINFYTFTVGLLQIQVQNYAIEVMWSGILAITSYVVIMISTNVYPHCPQSIIIDKMYFL